VKSPAKDYLRAQRDRLDQVELLHRIRQGQTALVALSTGGPSDGPDRESLNQFLAGLPQLWRMGEARPTHRKQAPQAHYWRTREDPFKNVWANILMWLQRETDSTAKSLLGRLIEKYPGQFTSKLLQTLHRRVSEWRWTMARRLVFGSGQEQKDVQPVPAVVLLVGEAALRLATLASAQPPQGEQWPACCRHVLAAGTDTAILPSSMAPARGRFQVAC
jgi:hypothetical protein